MTAYEKFIKDAKEGNVLNSFTERTNIIFDQIDDFMFKDKHDCLMLEFVRVDRYVRVASWLGGEKAYEIEIRMKQLHMFIKKAYGDGKLILEAFDKLNNITKELKSEFNKINKC